MAGWMRFRRSAHICASVHMSCTTSTAHMCWQFDGTLVKLKSGISFTNPLAYDSACGGTALDAADLLRHSTTHVSCESHGTAAPLPWSHCVPQLHISWAGWPSNLESTPYRHLMHLLPSVCSLLCSGSASSACAALCVLPAGCAVCRYGWAVKADLRVCEDIIGMRACHEMGHHKGHRSDALVHIGVAAHQLWLPSQQMAMAQQSVLAHIL